MSRLDITDAWLRMVAMTVFIGGLVIGAPGCSYPAPLPPKCTRRDAWALVFPCSQPEGEYRRVVLSGSDGAALREPGALARFYVGSGSDLKESDFARGLEIEATRADVRYIDLAIAHVQTCAIQDNGEIDCLNDWPARFPNAVPAPGGQHSQIACTEAFCCATRLDGTLVCWGHDLSLSDDGPPLLTIPEPPAGVFTQLSASGDVACAVRDDGQILCWWGDSPWGDPPAQPPEGSYRAVTVGWPYSYAIDTNGEVVAWNTRSSSKEAPAPPAGPFSEVAGHGELACGLRPDGELHCWGFGAVNGADDLKDVPPGHFTQVVGGDHVWCAIETSRRLVCWGYGDTLPCNPAREACDNEDSCQ